MTIAIPAASLARGYYTNDPEAVSLFGDIFNFRFDPEAAESLVEPRVAYDKGDYTLIVAKDYTSIQYRNHDNAVVKLIGQDEAAFHLDVAFCETFADVGANLPDVLEAWYASEPSKSTAA